MSSLQIILHYLHLIEQAWKKLEKCEIGLENNRKVVGVAVKRIRETKNGNISVFIGTKNNSACTYLTQQERKKLLKYRKQVYGEIIFYKEAVTKNPSEQSGKFVRKLGTYLSS